MVGKFSIENVKEYAGLMLDYLKDFQDMNQLTLAAMNKVSKKLWGNLEISLNTFGLRKINPTLCLVLQGEEFEGRSGFELFLDLHQGSGVIALNGIDAIDGYKSVEGHRSEFWSYYKDIEPLTLGRVREELEVLANYSK
jgi:hypothetical protein